MSLRCDLILRDATSFNGTGTARTKGDVGVCGERIVAVGDLGGCSAEREVIAAGKAVAPGVIDAHTHDDRAVRARVHAVQDEPGCVHRGGGQLRHQPLAGAGDIPPDPTARPAGRRELVDLRQRRRRCPPPVQRSLAGQHLRHDRPHAVARGGHGRRREARGDRMDEADTQRIMQHPLAMIGFDGLPHDRFPPPRLWGCFPRLLGPSSRERKLFSMATAIHQTTGRVEEVFGITDRGVIRPGAHADLVLFDPATVKDAADFENPTRPSVGMLATWVNGQSAYGHGQGASEARARRLVTRGRA